MPAPIPPLPRGIEDDPEVRAKAKRLLVQAYDTALEMLEESDPATKKELVKALLPIAARSFRDKGDDEEMAALRATVEATNTGLREAIGMDAETA